MAIRRTSRGFIVYAETTGRDLSKLYRTLKGALRKEDEIRRIKCVRRR